MSQSLSLSVAMCTYNGERYLAEQLDSILRQSRLPDELIIIDDQSTDSTVQLLRQFVELAPFVVKLHQNEHNQGSTRSFERAVGYCTGAIIVFSDQDDVWHADRLLKTEAYFLQHPTMNAVFSDAKLIDECSKPTGRRIWQEVQFTAERQRQWLQGGAPEVLFFSYVVTGATLAIRRSVLPLVLPFPLHVPLLIHDAWMALVIGLQGTIGFVDECLISYRQHTHQQVGFRADRKPVTLRDRFTRGREEKMIHVQQTSSRYKLLYDLLENQPGVEKDKLRLLNRLKDHLNQRTRLPKNRMSRILPVLRETIRGNYQLFRGRWWLTIAGDLLEE